MVQSHFFGVSVRDRKPVPFEERFTEIILPERNDDGSITKSTKVLETVLDPLSTLSFSDYSINNMLAAGITPKAIHISNDIRIGSDKEIEKFNKRVDDLAEQMFNN